MSDFQYCLCFANCEVLSDSMCSDCTSGGLSCFDDECFVTSAR